VRQWGKSLALLLCSGHRKCTLLGSSLFALCLPLLRYKLCYLDALPKLSN